MMKYHIIPVVANVQNRDRCSGSGLSRLPVNAQIEKKMEIEWKQTLANR
jgi:hypothetical protein